MKKYIYFTVLLFLVLLPKEIVKADCSDTEIVRLQKIANNINFAYQYNEKTNKFTILVTNLKKDVEIRDTYNSNTYNTNGQISINDFGPGKYSFKIFARNKECTENEITSRTVTMPFYNYYYKEEACKGHEDKYYCLKWLKSDVEKDEWEANVKKYKTPEVKEKETVNDTGLYKIFEKIKEFYSKYYFVILPIIIIILLVAIYRDNKKNKLV